MVFASTFYMCPDIEVIMKFFKVELLDIFEGASLYSHIFKMTEPNWSFSQMLHFSIKGYQSVSC